jgi:type IV pilus assembly protein PilV
MPPKHKFPHAQRGIGLIDALVAMVIFSFGLMGLAALYANTAPTPYENQSVMTLQAQADSLMSTLATNPAALSSLSVAGVNTASGMPAWLQDWFTQAQAQLQAPGLNVTITPGPDASGNACSAQSCGITVTLGWTQMGLSRTQVFHGQIGIN